MLYAIQKVSFSTDPRNFQKSFFIAFIGKNFKSFKELNDFSTTPLEFQPLMVDKKALIVIPKRTWILIETP